MSGRPIWTKRGPQRPLLMADFNLRISEEFGAPGTIRTSDPQIRSLMLYPAELRARMPFGEGAETSLNIAEVQPG